VATGRTSVPTIRGGASARAIVPPVTRAQIIFSTALGLIALLIMFFGLYVASSTMWGDRWTRRRRK
jgi:hypothetical protein